MTDSLLIDGSSEALLSESVVIVLVGTTHPGNIGAVARAMKNMRLMDLRLVKPKSINGDESISRAAGATDVLDKAAVFSDLDSALDDVHHVVGASARVRSFPWPIVNPRDCANDALQIIQSGTSNGGKPKVAFVFGRESSGLTNEELQRCNAHVHIPANPDYSSLNLAMAVQVITYELRMTALLSQQDTALARVQDAKASEWDAELSTQGEVEGMLNHLESVVTKTEFFDPNNPGQLMPRLRRLFQRRNLDKMEVNILRGILKSIEKKLSR